jgi:hypothetical protein
MDEPLRSSLRPARAGGLTRPDPVTAPARPPGHQPPTAQPAIPGQAAGQVSGKKNTPGHPDQDRIPAGPPGNNHPQLRGGSRLSDSSTPSPDSAAPNRSAVPRRRATASSSIISGHHRGGGCTGQGKTSGRLGQQVAQGRRDQRGPWQGGIRSEHGGAAAGVDSLGVHGPSGARGDSTHRQTTCPVPPLLPASPARRPSALLLCTSLWMTCAKRQSACVHTGNAGDYGGVP